MFECLGSYLDSLIAPCSGCLVGMADVGSGDS